MRQCRRLVTPEGLDIGQDRVLVEIEADEIGEVGVDEFVVGDPVADRIGHTDPTGTHR